MTRARDTANIDTILTTKGDIYAATAAFTPGRLAVGESGSTLLADSSTSTGLRWGKDPVSDLVTSAGDTLYGTAADTLTRLGIGSSGQVLTVSGGVPTWQTPTSGGMTLITTATPTGVGTYTFSSIPSTYKHLLILIENLSSSAGEINIGIRVNSDSGSNYFRGFIRTVQNTVSAATQDLGQSSVYLGIDGAQNGSAWHRLQSEIWIWDYAGSQPTKSITANSWGRGYATSADQKIYSMARGGWNSSSAINSVTLYDMNGPYNFSNGTLKLYGVS